MAVRDPDELLEDIRLLVEEAEVLRLDLSDTLEYYGCGKTRLMSSSSSEDSEDSEDSDVTYSSKSSYTKDPCSKFAEQFKKILDADSNWKDDDLHDLIRHFNF